MDVNIRETVRYLNAHASREEMVRFVEQLNGPTIKKLAAILTNTPSFQVALATELEIATKEDDLSPNVAFGMWSRNAQVVLTKFLNHPMTSIQKIFYIRVIYKSSYQEAKAFLEVFKNVPINEWPTPSEITGSNNSADEKTILNE